jgi:hypothetical protein
VDPFVVARLGFDEARQRLTDAYDAPGGIDFDHTFLAIGEAVMWACSLDDLCLREPTYGERRDGNDDGLCLLGVRLARNVALHQLVEVADLSKEGRSYPRIYPLRYWSWRWLPIDRLPPRGQQQRRGVEPAYEHHVASRKVETTLRQIAAWFDANAAHRRAD